MPAIFDDQQIVFRLGKFYRVSRRSTADGAVTTEETELRDWNTSTELSPHPAEPLVSEPTPATMDAIVVNGRLDDGSTHSLLDMYDANNAWMNLPLWVEYPQRQPLEQAWRNIFDQLLSDTHSELSERWGGQTDFVGGSGNDTLDLYGGSGAHFYGGAGNDSLYVAYGDGIFMDGGAGKDQLNIWSGSNIQFTGGAGDDRLIVTYGHYVSMTGGDGNDEFSVASGSHYNFSGGAGDDILRAGFVPLPYGQDNGSESVIDGGTGNDQLLIDTGTNTLVTGGEGNDLINVLRGDNVRISGGDGADSIISGGTTGAQIDGGNGNDRILLLWANGFTLDGGAGDDFIIAGLGGGTVRGGTGNDVICGDPFNVWNELPIDWRRPSADFQRFMARFMEQGTDTYVFEQGSGHDTIRDFMIEGELLHNGEFTQMYDQIDIRDYNFTDFNAVLAASTQEASGVRISFDANDSVLLTGISVSMLTAQNFIL